MCMQLEDIIQKDLLSPLLSFPQWSHLVEQSCNITTRKDHHTIHHFYTIHLFVCSFHFMWFSTCIHWCDHHNAGTEQIICGIPCATCSEPEPPPPPTPP